MCESVKRFLDQKFETALGQNLVLMDRGMFMHEKTYHVHEWEDDIVKGFSNPQCNPYKNPHFFFPRNFVFAEIDELILKCLRSCNPKTPKQP